MQLRFVGILAFWCAAAVLAPLNSTLAASVIEIPVKIAAEADTAVEAKKTALDNGMIRALEHAYQSFSASYQRQKLPKITAKAASALLTSMTPVEEVVGFKSFKAVYKFGFDRRALISIFKRNGVTFIDRKSPPILIFPLLEQADGRFKYLNRRDALYKLLKSQTTSSSLKAVLPSQTISDRMLDPEHILNRDSNAMQELYLRYNVRQSIIVHIGLDEQGLPQTVRLLGDDSLGDIVYETQLDAGYRRIGSDPWSPLMSELVKRLEERWKNAFAHAQEQ